MIPCITHYHGRRGCLVHGEHRSNCTGIGYGARTGRADACSGCLPQPATHGLMCESCWQRFDAALDIAAEQITHLRSVVRGSSADAVRTRALPGSRVIIPLSWLTADDTWAALHDLAVRVDPQQLLQKRAGRTTAHGFGSSDTVEHVRDRVELAVDLIRARSTDITRHDTTAWYAVRYYRQMQRALAQFPLQEDARPVPYARCRHCGLFTLERRPPLEHRDAITVLCINPACQWEWDPHIVELDLAAVRHSLEKPVAA